MIAKSEIYFFGFSTIFKILLFLPDREKNYQVVNSRFVKMMKRNRRLKKE